MTEPPTPPVPNPRRVLRWAVPVNDNWNPIGPGRIVHVACRPNTDNIVNVWTLEDGPDTPPANTVRRYVRIFGTGQTLTPDTGNHLGSALTVPDGVFAWHVFEQAQDIPA